MKLALYTAEIADRFIRDNFRKIQEALRAEPILKPDFRFFEFDFTNGAVTQTDKSHGLGYLPKDVILLSASNSADVIFHYDDFTKTSVNITTSAACKIRCLIGRFEE